MQEHQSFIGDDEEFARLDTLLPRGFFVHPDKLATGIRAALEIMNEPLYLLAQEAVGEWGFIPASLTATPVDFRIVHKPSSFIYRLFHGFLPAYYEPLEDKGVLNTGDISIWLKRLESNELLSRNPFYHGLALIYAEELVVHHFAQKKKASGASINLVYTANEKSNDIFLFDKRKETSVRRRDLEIVEMWWQGLRFRGTTDTGEMVSFRDSIDHLDELFAKYFTTNLFYKIIHSSDQSVPMEQIINAVVHAAFGEDNKGVDIYRSRIQRVRQFIDAHNMKDAARLYFSSSLAEKTIQTLLNEEHGLPKAQQFVDAMLDMDLNTVLAILDHVWPEITKEDV